MHNISLNTDQPLRRKLRHLNRGLILLIIAVACVGFTALYSAAGGHLDPWASRQMVRGFIGLGGMIIVALIDVRFWYRMAYPIYGVAVILLVLVDIMGKIGMGAQRWIDLGVIQLQPSEIMKIAAVMALARWFHNGRLEDAKRLTFLVMPALAILVPVGLVMVQPDLGTAGTILMVSIGVFFVAGAPLWLFLLGGAAGLGSLPIAWHFLHEYQRQRVLTFMNPEADPLGTGYHIMQSKIALGSGGIFGKGFLQGSQSHLNFLPEKQTDFIFTLWAEEWGLAGGLFLLTLFGLIMIYCGWISMSCRHTFGRIMAFGLMLNFSLYIFINTAMVMGLIPVVGVPLPMVSYGGTAMLAVLFGFGLIMSCSIHRDAKLPRM